MCCILDTTMVLFGRYRKTYKKTIINIIKVLAFQSIKKKSNDAILSLIVIKNEKYSKAYYISQN